MYAIETNVGPRRRVFAKAICFRRFHGHPYYIASAAVRRFDFSAVVVVVNSATTTSIEILYRRTNSHDATMILMIIPNNIDGPNAENENRFRIYIMHNIHTVFYKDVFIVKYPK